MGWQTTFSSGSADKRRVFTLDLSSFSAIRRPVESWSRAAAATCPRVQPKSGHARPTARPRLCRPYLSTRRLSRLARSAKRWVRGDCFEGACFLEYEELSFKKRIVPEETLPFGIVLGCDAETQLKKELAQTLPFEIVHWYAAAFTRRSIASLRPFHGYERRAHGMGSPPRKS